MKLSEASWNVTVIVPFNFMSRKWITYKHEKESFVFMNTRLFKKVSVNEILKK